MTAEIFNAKRNEASRYYGVLMERGGSRPVDATAAAALSAVTTANNISEVLDIIREQLIRESAVVPNGIGYASHVDA